MIHQTWFPQSLPQNIKVSNIVFYMIELLLWITTKVKLEMMEDNIQLVAEKLHATKIVAT